MKTGSISNLFSTEIKNDSIIIIALISLIIFVPGCLENGSRLANIDSISTDHNVSGLVKAPEYGAIQDALVQLKPTDSLDEKDTMTTLTDSDGNFAYSNVKAGEYILAASTGSHMKAYKTIEVKELATTDVGTIQLTPTGAVSGTLTAGGSPIPDAIVYIAGTPHVSMTDSNGNFEFQSVATGSYTVSFKLGENDYSISATVTAGETTDLGTTAADGLVVADSSIIMNNTTETCPEDFELLLSFYDTETMTEPVIDNSTVASGITISPDDKEYTPVLENSGNSSYLTLKFKSETDDGFVSYDLNWNTTYTITVGTSLLSEEGSAMLSPYSVTFTTASGITEDVESIMIGPYDIELHDTVSATPGYIEIYFTEGMDKASVESALTLADDGETQVSPQSYYWTDNLRVLTIYIPTLSYDSTYTLGIDTSAKTVAGNAISAAVSESFTTKGSYTEGTIGSAITFYAAESPYILTDNLTITDTLTIESGTTIVLNGCLLSTSGAGNISSIGTASTPINFVHETTPSSNNISLNSTAASIFSYCNLVNCMFDITLAGGSEISYSNVTGSSITDDHTDSTDMDITDCIFNESVLVSSNSAGNTVITYSGFSNAGSSEPAIYINDGSSEIDYCDIRYNDIGIKSDVSDISRVSITNSNILNNQAYDFYQELGAMTSGITTGCWWGSTDTSLIDNYHIYVNSGGANLGTIATQEIDTAGPRGTLPEIPELSYIENSVSTLLN